MGLVFAGRRLESEQRPHVMGIVNVTPDSFYDGGATAGRRAAIERGLALVRDGAAIVDVGGMTARPGRPVPEGTEIERVAPVVSALRARTDAVISVDTYRSTVAAAALDAGADLINDHTGLSDPALAAVVAERGGGLVVTHLGLAPKQPQSGRYAIDMGAIADFLSERVACAERAGVRPDAIMIDPGLGFGKDTATDLETLRRLPELVALGTPVLLACSHKEVTAEPLGLPESSLEGTAAVVAVAAYVGVAVLRVHDLPFMRHVARMGRLLRGPDRSVP
jgi:dihydropteroate synthase